MNKNIQTTRKEKQNPNETEKTKGYEFKKFLAPDLQFEREQMKELLIVR